uniref:Uncharacterized protein n=1 Tax=Romanomermis culicivorax TaxID=13658 RepID=A0A915KKX5_ROMCU
MELFKSEAVEAGARASNSRSNVEKGAFAISYNLANSEDDLAIMALSEEQKYLNTENVNLLCRRRTGRKKREAAVPYCGLDFDEEVSELRINLENSV